MQSTRCANSLPRAEGTEEGALFKLLLSYDSATDVWPRRRCLKPCRLKNVTRKWTCPWSPVRLLRGSKLWAYASGVWRVIMTQRPHYNIIGSLSAQESTRVTVFPLPLPHLSLLHLCDPNLNHNIFLPKSATIYSPSSPSQNLGNLSSEEHYLMRQHVCLKWTFSECSLFIRHCSSAVESCFIFSVILWSKFYSYPYFTLFKKAQYIEKWNHFPKVQRCD